MAKNIIAVLVLVGLAVAAYFVFRTSPEVVEEKEKVEKTLESIPRDLVHSVEIIRHEGTGVTLREEIIVLERAGDTWRMRKPVEYGVNTTSVDRVLEALEALRTIDIISEQPERHHVLEVDDELGIEVTVHGAKEEVLANFIVGVSRKNMTMVRMPGSDVVYRANGSFRTTFNKSAKNIRDRTVAALERGSVTRVKMTSDKGVLELNRVGEQPADREGMAPIPVFEPVGAEVQNFNVRMAAGTANSLTGLTAKDFVDEPLGDDVTGLGEGAATVEFDATTKDGKKGTFTFWIGSDIEKSRQTYVKTSISDQVFLVSSHLVMRYRGVSVDDFARTDEQVAQENKQREAALAHAKDHEKHAEMQRAMQQAGPGGPGGPGSPGPGGQISPEMMEKIRAQMEKKGLPKGGGKSAGDGHDHAH